MAIIDPDGLFHGERLSRCSDLAQLFWPRFLLAANGYGRVQLDYKRLLRGPLASLANPPTKKEVLGMFREYRREYLAFPYISNGEPWAQWHVPPRLLSKYQTAADRRSPGPPALEYKQWIAEYEQVRKTRRVDIVEFEGLCSTTTVDKSTTSEISQTISTFIEPPETTSIGIGIGIGIGDGIGEGKKKKAPAPKSAPFVLPEWIPVEAWGGYEEMRQKIRRPLTDRARGLAVHQLADLRSRGHPPEGVLNQSVLHSWQGLFEIKEQRDGPTSKPKPRSSAEERRERIRARTFAAAGIDANSLSGGNKGAGRPSGSALAKVPHALPARRDS